MVGEGSGPRAGRGVRGWLAIFGKGAAMGVAELIPGVSGGTIAFITGIYVELVDSIRRIDLSLLGPLRRGDFRGLWTQANAGFLGVLGLGMAVSVFGLASLVAWLLEHRPLELWGFFFGLIVASTGLVALAVAPWNRTRGALMVSGVLFGVGIALMAPVAAPAGWGFLFLGGAIAVCAWILPGVSGSYLLLLLGLYPVVVAGVASRDLMLVLVFGSGCAFGLLAFSRALSALLRRAYRGTLAFLAGVMAGSVLRLWPWRLESAGGRGTLDLDAGASGGALVSSPTLTLMGPGGFAEATGVDPRSGAVLLTMLVGVTLVWGLHRIARTNPEHPAA
jgi:putative membrane protein